MTDEVQEETARSRALGDEINALHAATRVREDTPEHLVLNALRVRMTADPQAWRDRVRSLGGPRISAKTVTRYWRYMITRHRQDPDSRVRRALMLEDEPRSLERGKGAVGS